MINKKRVNKVTKLTVASAIAFSALAQPLGTLVTVKAAEAPATTKAERQLLNSTASIPVAIQNSQFTSTDNSIPGWTAALIDNQYRTYADPFYTSVALSSKESDGFFSLDSKKDSQIRPNGNGGFQVKVNIYREAGLQQEIDTIPGVKYTLDYTVTLNASGLLNPYDAVAYTPRFRVYVEDGTGRNTVASAGASKSGRPLTNISPIYRSSDPSWNADPYAFSFVATTTKTKLTLSIGHGQTTNLTSPSPMNLYTLATIGDIGLNGSATINIATPTINTVTDNDTVVTGTGAAGKTISIKLPDGSTKTGTVGNDGKYSIEIPKQAKDKVIKALLYDGQGNVSPEASTTVIASTVAPPTINTVTTDDVVVKGTGIPGQRVYYKVGSADWYEYRYATVGADGTYSFFITNQPAGTLISVKHTVGGVDSTVATTTVIQGTVAAPTINGVKSDDTTVKGTGIPGATVTVTIAGQDRTATVGQDGNYSVIIPAQAVGTVITAKQTLNNKTSDPVSTTVTQGTVADPTINPLTTDSTSVKGTGINGATVTITIGSNTYTGTVSGGEYTITIPKQAVGTIITAKQSLNNQTSGSVNTTVTQGTVAAPTINGVKSDDTTVKGTGIPGATVTVTIAGQDRTATVGQDGNYSVTIPSQAVGTVITAKQTLNNKTSDPVSTTVTQGTVAVPTINTVTTDDTTVKGTGLAGATVTVTIAGQERTATVGQDGNYSVTIPAQAFGTAISVKQTLNGQTSTNATTTVTQGTVAAPTVNGVKSNDTTVKGTGIPGATVTVTIAGQDRTATVGQDGNYSVTIPAQAVGTVITAKQALNGKTSDPVSTTVTQGTVADPTINPVTTDNTSVKGTGINGATVTITIGSNTYTGTVSGGEYTITIPKQAVGTVISAKQSLNNQTSGSVNTTVTQGVVTPPTVNPVTTDDTAVTGTGMKGALVKLTIAGIDYTGLVDNNGNYSIAILKQPAGTIITATESLNGITSSPITATVQAGMAATTINALTTDSTVASGTAEPNSTVVIKNQAGTQLATGRVGSDGLYSLTIAKQASGAVVTATATANGKTSSASTTVTRDGINATTLNPLTADSTVASGTAEPNATIVIKNAAGTTIASGTVGSDGIYSITIPKQAEGTVVTATATKDGKTANATVTVTPGQGIAATTLGALTNESTVASGTGEPNATIVIKAGSTTIATGTIGSDGKYSLTIPKQAVGVVVTATATKDGKTSNASVTVSKQAAGTITVTAPYYVGYDGGIKATVSGDATKVYLLVGDTKYTTVPVSGSFEYYAKDKITSTTQNAYLVALDASGKEVSRAKVTLKDGNLLRGTVTGQDYIIGGGNYVTGSYTGSVAKVALSVNGTVYPSVAVTGAGALQYYAKDKITNTTDIVKLIGYNSEGTQIATTPVTVYGPGSLVGAITVNPPGNFAISTDSYVKGTFTGNVKTVALVVNDVESAKVGVVDGTTWQYYAKGKILNPTDTVSVRAYNAAGVLVDTKNLTVSQNPAGQSTLTPAAFKLKTDSFVKGTFTGSVRYVALKVGDVVYSKVAVVDAANWQYYAKDKILNTTAPVSIIGYDSTGTQITSAAVTINPEDSSTLTTNTYKLGDPNATGNYTGTVKYVAVKVNTTTYGKVPVNTDGTYQYYIKDKVGSKDDVVTVYGYDATGAIVAQKAVTIDPGVAPTMTVDPFVIGTSKEVSGTYTGGIKYVAIKVGDTTYSKVPVADDGTYKYYAKDKITNGTTKVTVLGYNAVGLALEKEVTLQ
ncbi:Ig-like domain-containing protein [Listeria booriae]|uniref:immunoglobulin-like domain-containing protein n=1 Tax=Listeria booriae TaxID=1552123 RepID=UPI00288095AC|nr:immunoglobulin-like domain-containing protein [Listeria booriae]MDT0111558.1 Ig-like domain-containing protein [Listeria booriae]